MTMAVALGTFGVPGLPGPVRGTLGRRRERIVVLLPAPLSVAATVTRASVPPATVALLTPASSDIVPAGLTAVPALATLTHIAPPGLRRRRRAFSQQGGATLASLERVRREREESQAAIGHQKSVFP
ncbi:hypothetical protein M878_16485 [Streptomyces roseochromogenus subsp. oscitans DS 12.976]|uniref:Uncharacterized protein n=1 Tax=Streptomyces roseochromogenus subsp. oscitans DS 12.976 TaxID=1352936 RepID=V6KHA5_STRRC|nr:hypothetical protein M878_16485 [Streptomyces roseochromogenus subsp. oscitans DS 12.976]